jgi:flagellar hook-associated protein 3 FlgL
MEKVASQKRVNRASDDPIAATKIIEIRQGLAANEQYRKNMDNAEAWLAVTESKLAGAYDLLVKAQELALGQATATATATTRRIAAQGIQSLIDEMSALANAKLGDRYLFSGSKNGVEPFSADLRAPRIVPAVSARHNAFAGEVTSGGAFTGSANTAYAVKITGGGPLAAATCQFSLDGGRSWNGADIPLAGGVIDLGDGVTLTFTDGGGTQSFGENDIFSVNAIAGGYYQGDDDALTLTVNRGTGLTYNITGEQAFTAAGSHGADIFKVLGDLKEALENNDIGGISGQLENLQNAQRQLTLNQSLCGAKASHIELTRNNLAELDAKLTSLLSEAQDADLADLATRLSMKEIALQATYAMAGQIGRSSILNFLK